MFLTTVMTQGGPQRFWWISLMMLENTHYSRCCQWHHEWFETVAASVSSPLFSACLHLHPYHHKPILIYSPHPGEWSVTLAQIVVSHFHFRSQPWCRRQFPWRPWPQKRVFSSRCAILLLTVHCWLSKQLPLKLETSGERPGATVAVWGLNSPFILINNCFNLRPEHISMGTWHSPCL